MAGTKEIKRRINSIKSTRKITKAMELVAASKMRRAVASALASRLYAGYSWEIITSISQNLGEILNPFFEEREVKNILIILITSNRGLCGAYNAQVIKKVLLELKIETQGRNIDFITLGKKGDIAMRRVGRGILASFFEIPDTPSIRDVAPVANLAINEYISGKYDNILVAYTDFVSALTQKPNIKKVLPISKKLTDQIAEQIAVQVPSQRQTTIPDYLFEGDKEKLISSLAEKITQMQIYQMILESGASEQSARMMAMKNASEASDEMISDLLLAFNKARQANITREISEISAGMASVSN